MSPASRTMSTALLAVVLLVAGASSALTKDQKTQPANAFRAGFEYVFQYDSQIALGLVEPSARITPAAASDDATRQPQKAATRLQCQVKIAFHTDGQATLRVDKPRVGETNALLAGDYAQRVQPMGAFERSAPFDAEKQRQLRLPVRFSYADGVIKAIRFSADDAIFSKNLKRAILNLIQVNLKPAKQAKDDKSSASLLSTEVEGESLYLAKSYAVNETTVEGNCIMTYSINSDNALRHRANSPVDAPANFNVSKTIDFSRCKHVTEVGFDAGEMALVAIMRARCAKCVNIQRMSLGQGSAGEWDGPEFRSLMKNCARQCTPSLNPADVHTVDRSTITRYMCAGQPFNGICALKRAELQARYVYKSGALADFDDAGADVYETSDVAPSQLAAVVAAEMELITVRPLERGTEYEAQPVEVGAPGTESLLFDHSAALAEKHYFMYGEAAFPDGKSPFADIKNKVDQSARTLLMLVESTSGSSAAGVEATTFVVYMPRLVRALRMASPAELAQIDKDACALVAKQLKDANAVRKTRELLADALAIAGTKNTIDELFQMIERRDISVNKAVYSLSVLGAMTPSGPIIRKLLHMSKSELAQRHPAIKQASLLSASALIGDACRSVVDDKYNNDEEISSEASSKRWPSEKPIDKNVDSVHGCSADDAKYYAKVLNENYKQAETLHEKILALKAIGNAALTSTMRTTLKPLIRADPDTIPDGFSRAEQAMLRGHASEALRRMNGKAPGEIRRLLVAVCSNVNEPTVLRMATFAGLMLTRPDMATINSIVYSLPNEPSRQVKAFFYTTLKSYAETHVKSQPKIAQQIHDALLLVKNVNEDMEEDKAESGLFTKKSTSDDGSKLEFCMMKLFGPEKAAALRIPTGVLTGINNVANEAIDQPMTNVIGVVASQIQLEKWAENVMKVALEMVEENDNGDNVYVRGQRNEATEDSSRKETKEQLRAAFAMLGMKKGIIDISKFDSSSPFGSIILRMGDYDKAVIPLDEQKLPSILATMVRGQRPTDAQIREMCGWDNAQIATQTLAAADFHERSSIIATAMGLPLKIHRSNPILTAINADVKLNIDSAKQAVSLKFQAYLSGCAHRLVKLESQLPGQIAVGVENMRAVEANLPVKGQLSLSVKEHLKLALETPKAPKTRLIGLHTLTATYKRAFDPETQSFAGAQMRAVSSPQLDIHQMEVNEKYGEHSLGLPIRVTGHYHALPKRCTGGSIGQSVLAYIFALTRVGVASENHLHVVFEPNADAPREFVFRADATAFKKISGDQVQNAHGDSTTLRDFSVHRISFSNDEYKKESSGDKYEMEKLNNFLAKIGKSSEKMYKHAIKVAVESNGGNKQFKADARLIVFCDASAKLCKLAADVKRTPMMVSESEWWELKARADVALPETVNSFSEMIGLADSKSQKMVANANVMWGPASSNSADKQLINIRIQGERDTDKAMEKLLATSIRQYNPEEDGESKQAQRIRRELSFINSFDLKADYKLSASAQNTFRSILEILQAKNFWNSESRKITTDSIVASTQQCTPASTGPSCTLLASMKIDPISQSYANVTIRTMAKTVHIESMALPSRSRPFPLISTTDSIHHMLKRDAAANQLADKLDKEGVKCVVGSTELKTYSMKYDTRVSYPECTLLAQDCGANKAFSVYLKKLDNEGQRKSLIFRTAYGFVECKGSNGGNKKLTCTNNLTKNMDDVIIEFNDDKIKISNSFESYIVEFACESENCASQKATIFVRSEDKYRQCGICAHDGNEESDIPSRLFYQPSGCSMQIEKQKSPSRVIKKSMDNDLEDEYNGTMQHKKKNVDEERQFISKSFNDNDKNDSQNENSNESVQNEFAYEDPELRTHIMEYNHQICFSVQPIKECAEGSTPKLASDLISDSDSINVYESGENQQQRKQQADESSEVKDEKINVKFTCLPRSSSQARRMQKEAQRGVTLTEELTNFAPNYSQKMIVPVKCLKYIRAY